MTKTTQLSVTGQIGLTLGCLLLFSVILTAVGYLAADEVRQKMRSFASEGVTVTGAITDKRIVRTTKSGIWVYWLELAFKTENGATRNQSAEVANSIFDKYQIDSPVRVTYVRSKPDWFYVPGGEPTERDAGIMAGMQKYGAIASLLLVIGLVVWFFVSRRGAPRQAPAMDLGRRIQGQSRPNFGTRRLGP